MNRNKIIKISVFSALCALKVYLLYSVIAYLVIWFSQPRFVSGDVVTSSWGFLIQFMLFSFFFIIVETAIVVTGILFFKKKKKNLTQEQ